MRKLFSLVLAYERAICCNTAGHTSVVLTVVTGSAMMISKEEPSLRNP